MFRIGDRIVCIRENNICEINKIFTINKIISSEKLRFCYICVEESVELLNSTFFIKLSDYRKQKLIKLQ